MGIVTYFGKNHGAPMYELSHQTPTPVGKPCIYCEETILQDEDGFTDSGGNVFHRECFLRMLSGSVAHMSYTCSCYGAERFTTRGCDEEGMTRREGAKAALAYQEQHREGRIL